MSNNKCLMLSCICFLRGRVLCVGDERATVDEEFGVKKATGWVESNKNYQSSNNKVFAKATTTPCQR